MHRAWELSVCCERQINYHSLDIVITLFHILISLFDRFHSTMKDTLSFHLWRWHLTAENFTVAFGSRTSRVAERSLSSSRIRSRVSDAVPGIEQLLCIIEEPKLDGYSQLISLQCELPCNLQLLLDASWTEIGMLVIVINRENKLNADDFFEIEYVNQFKHRPIWWILDSGGIPAQGRLKCC